MNEIFEQLASTSSRLDKESILNSNKDNELLKQVAFLALDPFTQFYVKKIPDYTPNIGEGISLKFALDSIQDLSKRIVTGNAAIAHLKSNLEALNAEDAKVIERIIAKDLKCGASVSTINKIWPNLIHEYPCMLCSGYDEKLINTFKFPAMVQLKMDGMRFNAIVKDGTVEFRSRNGKEIQLLGYLADSFIALANNRNIVFDGELLVVNNVGILDRQTGNGILNKAVKGTISDAEASRVRATLWDAISYEDFKNGISNTSYKDRFESLQNAASFSGIQVVEYQTVQNIEDARTLFEHYLNQGQEGIILKDLNGKWEDKRVKHQIKFKGELECDLEVIDYEEGTGKYVGKLGALVCRSRSTDAKPITVSIGSGFNDSNRDEFWNIRDSLIGKIVAVKYNARIKNKQGEESLFLPIFLELREDKDMADTESNIK